jgi:exodeoxyribonuclease VIII
MTDRISKSGLDKIRKTPAHYKTPQEETAALRFGRIAHEYILEGKQNWVLSPFDSFRTKEAREWRDAQTLPILIEQQDQEVFKMAMSVHNHEAVKKLIYHGQAEQTYLFDEPTTGAPCRCRPDYITKDNFILDLKTTDDASARGFAYSCRKYRYDVQAAFYLDGVEYATGIRPERFIFIAVEKKAPYAVGVYEIDDESVELARIDYIDDLKKWQRAEAAGEFPAVYNNECEIIKVR